MEQEQQDERERVRAARAEARAGGKRCPCCSDPVPDVPADGRVLTFRTLRENDVHEVFRITADRRLVFAEDVTPQEAAVEFAAAITQALRDLTPRPEPTA